MLPIRTPNSFTTTTIPSPSVRNRMRFTRWRRTLRIEACRSTEWAFSSTWICHSTTRTRLRLLLINFQRFAALGLEVHITELDIRLSDSSTASLNAQAKLYGELATICVRQPSCKVFQTWGFTDKHSWIPQFFPGMGSALLWDANYQKKPAYASVNKALQ